MPVDVEHFHRACQLAVIALEVKAMLNLLPPECDRLFLCGHPRLNGPIDDRAYAAEIVAAIGEPRIDDVGVAHVLHSHRSVGFPCLLKGCPDALWRTTISPVHRATMDD